MRKMLKSKRGFTLSELLIAVLILGLVTAGAAVGVNASLKAYHASVQASEARMLLSTLSESVMDELRYAENISADGDNPSYTSANYGIGATLQDNDDGQIVAFTTGSSIIGTGAYNGLKAEIAYPYESGVFNVTITVKNGSKVLETTSFSVTPITE